jgi:transposase
MHPGSQIDSVYLCREPVDFRKSIDGLSAMVEQSFGANPFGAALHVFVNKSRTKIKALYWHRNGFCLWYKRLESQRFSWPSAGVGLTCTVSVQELQWLLEGFDLWRGGPHKSLHFESVT